MFTPKQEKADPSNDTVQNNKSMVVIPYVHSLSEAVTQVNKCYSTPTSIRPPQSITSLTQEQQVQHLKFSYKNIGKKFHSATQGHTRAQYPIKTHQSSRVRPLVSTTSQIEIIQWLQTGKATKGINGLNRRSTIHIRKQQNYSVNRDEGPINCLASMTNCSLQRNLAVNGNQSDHSNEDNSITAVKKSTIN